MCDKVCQLLVAGRWFSPGTLVSSTNKTDRPDILIVESGANHNNPIHIFRSCLEI
jgi:hypothetical protein